MTLRLFVLQAHYRKPLDFTSEALEAAATGWHGLNEALSLGLDPSQRRVLGWESAAAASEDPAMGAAREAFITAMDDDLNTSAALAVLFDLARPLRAMARRLARGSEPTDADRAQLERWTLLRELSGVLGLREEATTGTAAGAAEGAAGGPDTAEIQGRISQRLAARQQKRYAEADAIRDGLREHGIELIDRPDGTTDWIRR
jgi:cysteinyl-tRNA synthetase